MAWQIVGTTTLPGTRSPFEEQERQTYTQWRESNTGQVVLLPPGINPETAGAISQYAREAPSRRPSTPEEAELEQRFRESEARQAEAKAARVAENRRGEAALPVSVQKSPVQSERVVIPVSAGFARKLRESAITQSLGGVKGEAVPLAESFQLSRIEEGRVAQSFNIGYRYGRDPTPQELRLSTAEEQRKAERYRAPELTSAKILETSFTTSLAGSQPDLRTGFEKAVDFPFETGESIAKGVYETATVFPASLLAAGRARRQAFREGLPSAAVEQRSREAFQARFFPTAQATFEGGKALVSYPGQKLMGKPTQISTPEFFVSAAFLGLPLLGKRLGRAVGGADRAVLREPTITTTLSEAKTVRLPKGRGAFEDYSTFSGEVRAQPGLISGLLGAKPRSAQFTGVSRDVVTVKPGKRGAVVTGVGFSEAYTKPALPSRAGRVNIVEERLSKGLYAPETGVSNIRGIVSTASVSESGALRVSRGVEFSRTQAKKQPQLMDILTGRGEVISRQVVGKELAMRGVAVRSQLPGVMVTSGQAGRLAVSRFAGAPQLNKLYARLVPISKSRKSVPQRSVLLARVKPSDMPRLVSGRAGTISATRTRSKLAETFMVPKKRTIFPGLEQIAEQPAYSYRSTSRGVTAKVGKLSVLRGFLTRESIRGLGRKPSQKILGQAAVSKLRSSELAQAKPSVSAARQRPYGVQIAPEQIAKSGAFSKPSIYAPSAFAEEVQSAAAARLLRSYRGQRIGVSARLGRIGKASARQVGISQLQQKMQVRSQLQSVLSRQSLTAHQPLQSSFKTRAATIQKQSRAEARLLKIRPASGRLTAAVPVPVRPFEISRFPISEVPITPKGFGWLIPRLKLGLGFPSLFEGSAKTRRRAKILVPSIEAYSLGVRSSRKKAAAIAKTGLGTRPLFPGVRLRF